MKSLYYTLRTLLRGRSTNLIKIVSLGLGLTLSILLFARVAFEWSYDNCFRDADNLYQLFAVWTQNGETFPPSEMNMGPIAGAILENFPEAIEAATSTCLYTASKPLFYGSMQFDERKVMADSLYFQTMGIEVLRGNTRDLTNRDVLFLSDRLAARIFGDDDPIGKVVSYGKEIEMTVRGIYRALPENTRFPYEAVLSMPTAWTRELTNYSWYGGDSYPEFIRFRQGADKGAVIARMDDLMAKYLPSELKEKMKIAYTTQLRPIRSVYRTSSEVKSMIVIMSLLGFAILFITALNYVLISISSLTYRAKAIGVHKCSGASGGTIFGMFMSETAIIVVAALAVMLFLLFNFRDFVEDTASAHLEALFAPDRMWVTGVIIVFFFLIGGVLPARIFARIPVTQVFHRYTDSKKGWKRPLLFAQFVGVALISGLITLVMMQYRYVLNKDLGYNPERVVYGYLNFGSSEQNDHVADYLKGLPYVEEVSVAIDIPVNGPSGSLIQDDAGKSLFSSRLMAWSDNYPAMMQMVIKEGRMPQVGSEVMVNESFAERMHWGTEIVGRQFNTEGIRATVSGVMKEFKIGDFFSAPMPMLAYDMKYVNQGIDRCYHVRLKEPFADNLKKLNHDVSQSFTTKSVEFKSLQSEITSRYNSVRVFRNATILAGITLFFIMMMGLVGYVSDEVRRRSKEIAIRKVNGAEASGILNLLSRDVLYIAVPAVLIGVVASWYVNTLWMELFTEQVAAGWALYAPVALGVLAVIVACVLLRAWKIANENPVKSIKSE
ncbi:MAG: ABC transporter permease [Prevotellaceae bacterium]|jgi:putative ABC transport system permease protein|nr:ABC transporter permease [Prevotellaceae bacterium]